MADVIDTFFERCMMRRTPHFGLGDKRGKKISIYCLGREIKTRKTIWSDQRCGKERPVGNLVA